MSLTLTVIIDEDQVQVMKEQGFNLFLAKLVQDQDKANVIWKSKSAFYYSNKFQWEPVFSISGSESVEPGALVSASTKVKPIGYGQSIEIDKDGNITDPSGPVTPGKAFRLTNKDTKNNTATVYAADQTKPRADLAPFFVSKGLEEDFNSVDILPIETVVLWFGQAQEAGTIIAGYSGPSCKVFYGNGDSKRTVEWTKDGTWEQVD
ncbi:hypothetical protein E1B28_002405 [Marasmius oreades]|uniref:Uncharacterized protein n=1 Tax=Marasmius oreades TaxID=181124 RepID=A0A9P7RNI8_9AGAR|nr:uncharacterized protein E1B28_002405 [Marasmius oreades]KAG7086453.1 hypothetical protein E1B28_002405 [Marasmius oreades]